MRKTQIHILPSTTARSATVTAKARMTFILIFDKRFKSYFRQKQQTTIFFIVFCFVQLLLTIIRSI